MLQNKSIAIITARGGSKRIPRKNIKLLSGKPAVAWVVEASLNSGLFDQVVISTEDAEIAKVACEFGAKRPFIRPQELSDDHTGTLPVLRHAIRNVGQEYETCCCLYGTSVFVTPELLIEGKRLLCSESDYERSAEAVMCAVQFEHPPQRGFYISNDRCRFVNLNDFNSRTQDLQAIYHDVGLFYWFNTKALIDETKRSLADFDVAPLVIPRSAVVDIDTEEDWIEAEKIFKTGIRD
ncbi:MAG: pseudaminic acid cytidylyltransferase [Synergistaceae bacterium]|nr:pseudaminic acid cytidylyltransferase [Synergistaceae bacterium]